MGSYMVFVPGFKKPYALSISFKYVFPDNFLMCQQNTLLRNSYLGYKYN